MIRHHAILLPFNNTQPTATVLDAARQMAGTHGYVEGAFCRQVLPIIAGEGITLPGDYLAEFEEEGRQQAEAARLKYLELLEARDIPFGGLDVSGFRAGWTEMVGSGPEGVGEYARLFDLVILGRSVEDSAVDWKTAAEAVMFDSGRPLLIVSDEIPATIGRKILLAWNGSTETARTLTGAMSILTDIDEVLVVTVDGAIVSGPAGEDVCRHLNASGISSTAQTIDRGTSSVAQAVLEAADKFSADLIIKGAFTHSRLRQLIFGGPTSELLSASTLPILLSH
ncbi:MAG: universal stress protein [Pseudomonadota bacterium]|nr:universal stress protein [Pseudomonadota bacterium]